MQMKAAIADMAAARRSNLAIPSRSRTIQAAASIQYPATDLTMSKPDDLDVIAGRIIEAFAAGTMPSRSDLRHAPWCLWTGRSPLVTHRFVCDRYLDYVLNCGRKSAFTRLASIYVIAFPHGHPSLKRVADVLRELAPRYPGPWSTAAKDLELFDPDKGPGRLAGIAIDRGSSPTDVLKQFRIDGLSADGGLSEAAFMAGLRQIREDSKMAPLDRLERVRSWGVRPDGRLVFEQHRGALVDALVVPHAHGDPGSETREGFLKFLLKQFSDPRLNPGRWEPMAPASTGAVRRWLVAQSLRQFLDVVDKVAIDRQWRYRRAFWEAVFAKGLISDARVIFDDDGAVVARRMFGNETPYARWASFPGQRGHACLLLRIGRGFVAEWSHNAQCHVWHNEQDPTVPPMHLRLYEPSDARIPHQQHGENKRVSFRHMSPHTYSWQNKVADEIRALTGVRLFQSDYEV